MYLLAHVPAARRILDEVQDRLVAQGAAHPFVQVPGQLEPVFFDLYTGLSVTDHGAPQPGLACVACPPGSGHGLRYEFRVTALSGETVGPLGSSCLFTGVLGQEEGRRIGSRLTDQVGAHQVREEAREQARRLAEAENWRGYMRSQGFDWVLTAMATSGGLPPELHALLSDLWDKERPLTRPALRQLAALTQEREAPPEFGEPALTVPPPPPTPLTRRTRLEGGRLNAADWDAYLGRNRVAQIVRHWAEIAPGLDLPARTRAFLTETIRDRKPFRLEDLTRLQELGRDPAVQARLQDFGPAELPAAPERMAPAPARAERIMDPGSGLEMLDVRQDPQWREAQTWYAGLRAAAPTDLWLRLQATFQDGRIRADDYAALCLLLQALVNPQPLSAYRTPRQFLTLLALHLGQSGHFTRAREVLDPARQAEWLALAGADWTEYEGGEAAELPALLSRVLAAPASRPRAKKAVKAAKGQTLKAPTTKKAKLEKRGAAQDPEASAQSAKAHSGKAQAVKAPKAAKVSPPAMPKKQATPPKAAAPQSVERAQEAVEAPLHPSLSPLQTQWAEIKAGWGLGLAELVPAVHRRRIAQAVRQGQKELTAEQIGAVQGALRLYRFARGQVPVSAQAAPEPRTPAGYSAALGRLFAELELPHLQAALAQQGEDWPAAQVPRAYRHFGATGTLTRDLQVVAGLLLRTA
ncbi:hypothetical protein [Deinococcus sp. Leaf326]|uniref:hypothetical protein n=1 Tax=Deinococcus sp. Leaf326 TaxID=1736338 RepID=UPI0006FAA50C|nr:hypothetical protein [Deinococcus sp. Leaf326]KQR25560.1 hypothetical protein ASF71_19125 [Deinococcus sp. Leaf326]